MKKAIVLLVIVSLVASLFAQAASESAADSKKVDLKYWMRNLSN